MLVRDYVYTIMIYANSWRGLSLFESVRQSSASETD